MHLRFLCPLSPVGSGCIRHVLLVVTEYSAMWPCTCTCFNLFIIMNESFLLFCLFVLLLFIIVCPCFLFTIDYLHHLSIQVLDKLSASPRRRKFSVSTSELTKKTGSQYCRASAQGGRQGRGGIRYLHVYR